MELFIHLNFFFFQKKQQNYGQYFEKKDLICIINFEFHKKKQTK